MIFEGWHREARITTMAQKMYESVFETNNTKMTITEFLQRTGAFDKQVLEIAKKSMGVEPIVCYLVDRGWLDIQKQRERMERYQARKQSNMDLEVAKETESKELSKMDLKTTKKTKPSKGSDIGSKVTKKVQSNKSEALMKECKHGCGYQVQHLSIMNMHEMVFCKRIQKFRTKRVSSKEETLMEVCKKGCGYKASSSAMIFHDFFGCKKERRGGTGK